MNINDNYTEFFRLNRELVLFTEQALHDLAEDNFHEDGLHPENAFETIFDDYLWAENPENKTPSIYLHDDWYFFGDTVRELRVFCEKGFEETVSEMRADWTNGLTDPGENITLQRIA